GAQPVSQAHDTVPPSTALHVPWPAQVVGVQVVSRTQAPPAMWEPGSQEHTAIPPWLWHWVWWGCMQGFGEQGSPASPASAPPVPVVLPAPPVPPVPVVVLSPVPASAGGDPPPPSVPGWSVLPEPQPSA